jgi:hypothetical protein
MMTTSYIWLLLLQVVGLSIVSAEDTSTAVSTSQVVESCEDGIIQVKNITISCDSPYTFYYGNGAHRGSSVCDYGDKVSLNVRFSVSEYIESTIYAQMSAYTTDDEQLYLGDVVDLCNDYVGKKCNFAGYYSFSTQLRFSYIEGEQSLFVPKWEITFSDSANGGYDLGAVNIECNMNDESRYYDWQNIRTNTTLLNLRTESFAQEYGILLLTSIALVVLGAVLLRQTRDNVDHSRSDRTQLLNSPQRL